MTRQRWQVERALTRPRFDPALLGEWRWSERANRLDNKPIHGLMGPRSPVTYCGRYLPAGAQVSGYGVVTCTACQEARRR